MLPSSSKGVSGETLSESSRGTLPSSRLSTLFWWRAVVSSLPLKSSVGKTETEGGAVFSGMEGLGLFEYMLDAGPRQWPKEKDVSGVSGDQTDF